MEELRVYSDDIKYRKYNGAYYFWKTPDEVVRILDAARMDRRRRLRLYFGETNPDRKNYGKDWNEMYGVNGYIGLSTGKEPVPLLLHNHASSSGGSIPTQYIVKITEKHKILYQHPNYHNDFFVGKGSNVYKLHSVGTTEMSFETKPEAIEFAKNQNNSIDDKVFWTVETTVYSAPISSLALFSIANRGYSPKPNVCIGERIADFLNGTRDNW